MARVSYLDPALVANGEFWLDEIGLCPDCDFHPELQAFRDQVRKSAPMKGAL
jgi:hypothetical protein